jgi:pimeloyl-ACP methyl ester carboxylesterase
MPRRAARRHNSTIVRTLSAARPALAALSRLAPATTARLAERFFFTPPRPRRSGGDGWLGSAIPWRLEVEGRNLRAWRWGAPGRPRVALLHGWGGRAAQLTSFVPALLARGFAVVALDAPGHGLSGRGRSSAPEFGRALSAAARRVGGVHGVIAHSLGGAAVALALRDGLAAARVVLVAPTAVPPRWVDLFAARLGLTSEVVSGMRRISERRIGLAWSELDVPALARGQRAALLVLHDRDDAEVPVGDGEQIASAWPAARLERTAGLGHNRILRDAGVVSLAVEHLAHGLDLEPGCACDETGSLPCQACLEQTLFDRVRRLAGAPVTVA